MALRLKRRLRRRPDRHGSFSQACHWATAVLVLALVPIGLAMAAASPGAGRRQLFEWHQSLGVLAWVVTLVRLWGRRYLVEAAPEGSQFRWQVLLAGIMHGVLYSLLIVMPLLGYFGASFLRQPATLFGVATIPPPPLPDWPAAGIGLLAIHRALAWVLLLLLIVHIGIALYHHFVARDRTLLRMLPERYDVMP
jgi:cytochrome b561